MCLWFASIGLDFVLSLGFSISFLDHLCAASGIPSKTSQRSNYVLKVIVLTILFTLAYCNNVTVNDMFINFKCHKAQWILFRTFYSSLADMGWHFIILWFSGTTTAGRKQQLWISHVHVCWPFLKGALWSKLVTT